MSDSPAPAVIAGLAIGILLIALFGSIFSETIELSAKPRLQVYEIKVGDKSFPVTYRFSDWQSELQTISADMPIGAVTVIVKTPISTTLEIHFPIEMLDDVFGQSYDVRNTALAIFIDNIEDDAIWQFNDNEGIMNVKLDAGSEMIEIAGTYAI